MVWEYFIRDDELASYLPFRVGELSLGKPRGRLSSWQSSVLWVEGVKHGYHVNFAPDQQ